MSLDSRRITAAKRIAMLVIGVNILLGVIGFTTIGVSIWAVVKTPQFIDYVTVNAPGALELRHFSGAGNDTQSVRIFAIIALTSGACLLLSSLAASIGAMRGILPLLVMHLLIIIMLLIGLTFMVFCVFLFGDELQILPGHSFFIYNTEKYKKQLKIEMAVELLLNRKDGFLVYANRKFNCCGIENSSNETGICEHGYPPLDKCAKGSQNCARGCFEPFYHSIYLFTLGTGIAVSASLGLLSFSALFGWVLFRLVRLNNAAAAKSSTEKVSSKTTESTYSTTIPVVGDMNARRLRERRMLQHIHNSNNICSFSQHGSESP